jgi:hypothetical protein
MAFSCLQAFCRGRHESHTYCLFFTLAFPFVFISDMLPPKRMELVTEFFLVIDSSKVDGYQNPTKLSRIYPGLLNLSKKIHKFVPSKQMQTSLCLCGKVFFQADKSSKTC